MPATSQARQRRGRPTWTTTIRSTPGSTSNLQSRSLDDVLADYDSTFERLAAALEAFPEATLADPDAFPWSDGEPLINFTFTEHLHEEHLPGIRAWLDSR